MKNVVYTASYNDYNLCYSRKHNQGHFLEVLQANEALFDYMVQQHSSVFMVMLVVKFPAGTPLEYQDNNALLSRFFEALTLHYKRKKPKGYDPKYVWARERSEKTGQTHYHVILLLDGNLIQNGYGILNKATELWGGCLGIENARGLVELCKPHDYDGRYGGVKIIRNDPKFQEVLGRCFQWASYLAKCFSKGQARAYVNEFGCSRLPPLGA